MGVFIGVEFSWQRNLNWIAKPAKVHFYDCEMSWQAFHRRERSELKKCARRAKSGITPKHAQ